MKYNLNKVPKIFDNKGVLFLLGSMVLITLTTGFFFLNTENKKMFLFLFIPSILGLYFQEFFIKTPIFFIIRRLIIISFSTLLVVGISGVGEISKSIIDDIALVFMYSVVGLTLFTNVLNNQKRYVLSTNIETILIQTLLLIYLLGGVEYFLYLSLPILSLGILYILKRTEIFKLVLSIFGGIIALIFGGMYIFSIISKYSDERFFSFSIICYFFFFGMALGFILQNSMMLLTYLPSKHQTYDRSHLLEIKKVNKQFLDRFSDSQSNLLSLLIILLLLISSVVYYSYFPFSSKELFIGSFFFLFSFILGIKDILLANLKH